MRKPSSSQGKSSGDAADLIVVARSARQLAAAARDAGLRPAVIDLFGDEDTCEIAACAVTLTPDPALRFPAAALHAALDGLLAAAGAVPVIWGSGFEGDPELLSELETRARMLGCDAAARAALADPDAFAATLERLGLAHPAVARAVPQDGTRWLAKQRGAAGGAHVREASAGMCAGPGAYFQRHVAGRSLSAAFVATPQGGRMLGLSEHWRPQPAAECPFRYGGAIGNAEVDEGVRASVARAVDGLCRTYALVGLCGLDFVLDDAARVVILEVNPRPTATFDLLTEAGAALAAHIAVGHGEACPPLPPTRDTRGHAVLYAEHPLRLPKAIDWPDWVADRPRAGTSIPAGAPVCSLSAGEEDAPSVQRVLLERFASLHRIVHEFKP